MDFGNNVKVAKQEIKCTSVVIPSTDQPPLSQDIGKTGDRMGNALRGQRKDVTKFSIIINSDGTLTFHSDSWPDLK